MEKGREGDGAFLDDPWSHWLDEVSLTPPPPIRSSSNHGGR